MQEYKLDLIKGSASAVTHLASAISGEAAAGEIQHETVKETLRALTDFRRYLRTVANNGTPPTRQTRKPKKA